MSISLIIPFRPSNPERDRAWSWLRAKHRREHPDWEIIETDSGGWPWNKPASVNQGARRANGDVLVICDADVWCDGIEQAAHEACSSPWAIPHRMVNRLDEVTTNRLLDGGPLKPIKYAQTPYLGHRAGGIFAIEASRFLPLDERFVGWGQEDDALCVALETLVGKPWRGDEPLYHLWHPAPQRASRRRGSKAGWALFQRYRAAKGNPREMRALIEESRCQSPPASRSRSHAAAPSTSTATATSAPNR